MPTIEIEWEKYDNFFDLWRKHRQSTKMLYVIGDQHHCYVGSIGSRDGAQGLETRYQWQYVNRSRSIFGKEESMGQVSYAGIFKNPEQINGQLILAAEAVIQSRCITELGPNAALFEPEGIIDGVKIINGGEVPAFLQEYSR